MVATAPARKTRRRGSVEPSFVTSRSESNIVPSCASVRLLFAPRALSVLRLVRTCLFSRIQVGKLLPQMFDLRRVVEHDVGLIRMQRRIILMVSLGRIEPLQWHDLGHDRARKYSSLVELRDVSLSNAFLLVSAVKN